MREAKFLEPLGDSLETLNHKAPVKNHNLQQLIAAQWISSPRSKRKHFPRPLHWVYIEAYLMTSAPEDVVGAAPRVLVHLAEALITVVVPPKGDDRGDEALSSPS